MKAGNSNPNGNKSCKKEGRKEGRTEWVLLCVVVAWCTRLYIILNF